MNSPALSDFRAIPVVPQVIRQQHFEPHSRVDVQKANSHVSCVDVVLGVEVEISKEPHLQRGEVLIDHHIVDIHISQNYANLIQLEVLALMHLRSLSVDLAASLIYAHVTLLAVSHLLRTFVHGGLIARVPKAELKRRIRMRMAQNRSEKILKVFILQDFGSFKSFQVIEHSRYLLSLLVKGKQKVGRRG